MKRLIVCAAVLFLIGGFSYAEPPIAGHSNLVDAHDYAVAAIDAVNAARVANEWDLGGKAAKADDLLLQAKGEITEAAKSVKGIYTSLVKRVATTVPVENIDPKTHPNLAAAQHNIVMAFNKLVAGQNAGDYDMDGHADHAKVLLSKADLLLKQAAEAANLIQ